MHNLAALFVPIAVALLFYVFLSYARFGALTGMPMRYSTNPEQREFAVKHGLFRLDRVSYSFADYFFLRYPEVQENFPFLRVMWRHFNHPNLYVMPFSETHLSILWSSSWLLLGAIIGIALLIRSREASALDRAIAIAFVVQLILILSFMGLCQRYTAELFPFLVFCFFIFLQRAKTAPVRLRYVMVALVVVSITINTLSTAFWLAQDRNLPAETRTFWKLGQATN